MWFPLGSSARPRTIRGPERAGVGERPVVVHCGAPDTRTTADLARHAEANGAAGVAVVVPYYFRAATPELFRHFSDVATAAPGVSHYVYENPENIPRPITAEPRPLTTRLEGSITSTSSVSRRS